MILLQKVDCMYEDHAVEHKVNVDTYSWKNDTMSVRIFFIFVSTIVTISFNCKINHKKINMYLFQSYTSILLNKYTADVSLLTIFLHKKKFLSKVTNYQKTIFKINQKISKCYYCLLSIFAIAIVFF